MESEPSNAASDRIHEVLSLWHDREQMVAGWDEWHTEDFVREDRRRLVSLPPAGRREHLDLQLLWFELGDGRPMFDASVLAVRGEWLALVRASTQYSDGQGREALSVVVFDRSVERSSRHVHFDLDDLDAALAELDRLNAEFEAEETRSGEG